MRSLPAAPPGTTLVELMVALGVLSVMAVLLLGGMRLGLRVWESGGDRQVFEQRLERADAFLRQLLGQSGRAPPPALMPGAGIFTGAGTKPIVKAGFVGESDRMRFVALLPYQLGSDGDYQFELSRHANAAGGNLVLGWQRNIGSTDKAESAGQTVLLGEILSLRIAYFGHLTNEAQSGWHENWVDPSGLPAMIRVDLSFTAGQQHGPLTLFYALRFSNSGV